MFGNPKWKQLKPKDKKLGIASWGVNCDYDNNIAEVQINDPYSDKEARRADDPKADIKIPSNIVKARKQAIDKSIRKARRADPLIDI